MSGRYQAYIQGKKCWLTLLKYQAMEPFHKDFDPDTPFYPNNYIKFAHEF